MRVVRIFIALGALTIAAPPVCATTFATGEFFTYDQFDYGTNSRLEEPNNPQAAALLEDNFDTVYAPFEDLVQVGVPGPAGHSLIFDSPDAVLAYLPASGTPGALSADLLDPLSSSSGVLGGEVVAATLNTDFSNAGLLAHPTSVALGDLVFQNLETLVSTNFFFYPVDSEIADLDGLPSARSPIRGQPGAGRVRQPERDQRRRFLCGLVLGGRRFPRRLASNLRVRRW
jgi:hypothetical protein